MATDVIELENELAWLSNMIATEGWKLYKTKFAKSLGECAGKLRDQDCTERDWYAGLVSGYERMLGYPDKRIIEILNTLKRANTNK